MNLSKFFAELKRRNVYKVGIAYGVVAWLLIQIATQVFPFFEIPNWAVRLIVLVVIVGFPIALVIAWAFELTPEGLKRTETADAEHLPGRCDLRRYFFPRALHNFEIKCRDRAFGEIDCGAAI